MTVSIRRSGVGVFSETVDYNGSPQLEWVGGGGVVIAAKRRPRGPLYEV